MKILAPIVNSEDISVLNPSLYGTEFFCGYMPQWWLDSFVDESRNDRNLSTPLNNRNSPKANVTTFSELKKIVEIASSYNTDVFLVLNAKYYPDYVYKSIDRYLNEVISAGISRMIVCDIGMIHYLEHKYPNIKVSVSCLNQVTNTMSAQFYHSFGNVDRIVFPRHMSSEEIKSIVMNLPDIEFEFFIFSNKCLYDDGYCRGIHEFTPICKDLYYSEFYSISSDIDTQKRMELVNLEREFSNWTRMELDCEKRDICTPSFACCACALKSLVKHKNIVSVKMSIRGHSVEERLRQVKMAREAITCVEEGHDIEDLKHIISKLYGKESLCRDGISCMMI